MVRQRIEDVTEEMILGQSIYHSNGDLLLAAGYHIQNAAIEKLKKLGYTFLYIQEPGTESIIPEEIITEHTARNFRTGVLKSFNELKDLSIFKEAAQGDFEKVIEKNKDKFRGIIFNESIRKSLVEVIDQIFSNPNLVLNLSTIKESSDSRYQHAINVTIISTAIGKKFGFVREELEQLAIGALNADIGMVAIAKEIGDKKDPLTEEENSIFKEHTTYGYLMLSKSQAIPAPSFAVALQHHERQDGQGYPRGLKGDNSLPHKKPNEVNKIHRYAEIVAVADIYDTLLTASSGPYVQGSSDKAIEYLIKSAGTHLNKPIVDTFIKMVPVYPVGAKFHITDSINSAMIGMRGVISKQNPTDLCKPQILVMFTPKGQRIPVPRQIDLEKVQGIKIEIIL